MLSLEPILFLDTFEICENWLGLTEWSIVAKFFLSFELGLV